jgi:hypothetical protein
MNVCFYHCTVFTKLFQIFYAYLVYFHHQLCKRRIVIQDSIYEVPENCTSLLDLSLQNNHIFLKHFSLKKYYHLMRFHSRIRISV